MALDTKMIELEGEIEKERRRGLGDRQRNDSGCCEKQRRGASARGDERAETG